MRAALAPLLLLTAVLLAACSGSDDGAVAVEPADGQGVTEEADAAAPGTDASQAGGAGAGLLRNDGSILAALFPTSAFYAPIPDDAPLHPDNDALVEALVERAPAGVLLTVTDWTIPAFLADADAAADVRLTAEWSPYGRMRAVPIPGVAQADPQDDGHLTVLDLENGWAYDFWQAERTTDGWEASWGNRIALDSNGVYPHGFSARGSGFSSLLGLVWPHELAQGRIDHALAFSTTPNRAGVLVAPASETDGASEDPLTLPEGTRLQLDPALDLGALDLEPWQRTIARALQEYGMILVDNGSESITLYHVHPASFGGLDLPFELDEGLAYLDSIPLARFRVLDFDANPFNGDVAVADESIYAGPRNE